MDGTGFLFEEFLRCLPVSVDTKIVAYPNQEHLSYRELEEIVGQELPVSGEYLLIAESFSGPIALRLADRQSEALRGVVLVSSFAYRPLGRFGALIARLPWRLIFRMPLPDSILRAFLLDESTPANTVRLARRVIKGVNPNVLAGRVREALTSSYCRRPIGTNAQIVAIYAKNDRLLGHLALKSIVTVCATAKTEMVLAPHFALQTNPPAVVDVLHKYGLLPE